MTKQTEAMRLALEFIDANSDGADERELAAVIREALAEQPAQPATYTCGVCGVSMQMEQPAQQQEPVAWLDEQHLVMRSDWRDRANYKGPWVDFGRAIPNSWVPVLYTSQPAQRKPLTNEMVVAAARVLSDRQAAACNVDCGDMWKLHSNDFLEDARAALEAAHGIKGDA